MGRHRYVLSRGIKLFHQALGRDAMLSAHPLPADGPTSLRPRPSYGAFPPGSRPRRNVVGPSIASGWADITMSSAEASSLSTRLSAETQCCRPIRCQRMGRHRYVLGRAMEPFHQALGRDAMLSAHTLLADGPTSLRPSTRLSAESLCRQPTRGQRMGILIT